MTPPVAVAVVSWNTRELLMACLESLALEAEAGRAEVWVVDNASTDGSPEEVADRFEWVTLVAAGENLGFGAAVNHVAARTQTEFIAPANADVALEPGALELLLAAAAAHPEAGAVAPRLVLADGTTQHSVHPFPSLTAASVLNLGLVRLLPRLGDRLCLHGAWDPDRPREVDWALGAFLLVRRSAWDEVGGFDTAQWMYTEDLDLGWRLAQAGRPTRYVPAARVRHRSEASTQQAWCGGVADRWQALTYTWTLRRRGAAFTRALALISLAGAAFRLAAFGVLARLRPARFGPPRDAARAWLRRHRAGLAPRAELERLR
ncbi:MAG: glycosyltransferase family 2 protein [Solirubrobacteraceae bacterium]